MEIKHTVILKGQTPIPPSSKVNAASHQFPWEEQYPDSIQSMSPLKATNLQLLPLKPILLLIMTSQSDFSQSGSAVPIQ